MPRLIVQVERNELIDELRAAIRSGVETKEERDAFLLVVDELRQVDDRAGGESWYGRFMALAAHHATVFMPFQLALVQLIESL